MSLRRLFLGTLAATTATVIASAQPAPATIDGLVSAAKVAAGTDWQGTFTRLCIPVPAAGGGTRDDRDPRALPPREQWHAEPAKVGDNFYFIGEKAQIADGLAYAQRMASCIVTSSLPIS